MSASQVRDLESIDGRVRAEVYRSFVERGRAPSPPEISEALAVPRTGVEDSLRRLHDAHVLVLAPGTPYVWMANPFSALPTPFAVDVGGREYFGNCIWDALGIVAVLGGSGRVRTSCPDCGGSLLVEVEGNELQRGSGVVHFAVPATSWWDDIGFN